VKLSTATAQASSSSLKLRFGGALDADSASDASHYAVAVNGRAVAVESAAYDASTHSVTLGLADGSLRTGDRATAAWSGVLDASGKSLSGQSGAVTVR
jgi:hypothetical protein